MIGFSGCLTAKPCTISFAAEVLALLELESDILNEKKLAYVKKSANCVITPVILQVKYNRPYHGFRRHLDGQAKRSEITVLVWESDDK